MIWYLSASNVIYTGEETIVRSTRLGLLSLVVAAAVFMAGCDDKDAKGDAAKPAGGNPPAAGSTPTNAAPPIDAASKAACATITKDIDANTTKVASAEKIGPPAGHSAVSAQYSAGSAAVYAHTFEATGEVNKTAQQVATAMSDLADAWAKAPKKAPSKEPLNTAIKQFKEACGAK
jgi:hypothetical protein